MVFIFIPFTDNLLI